MFIADYLFDQLSTLGYTSHSCPKGRLQHVSIFYENANIIAFVGAACLKASDPRLIQMASDLRGNVAVVEICSTGTEPGELEQCRMVRGVKEKSLITICDGGGRDSEIKAPRCRGDRWCFEAGI